MSNKKRNKIKKFITVLLCFTMMFQIAGCGDDFGTKTGKYAWIDSNIPENQQLASEYRLQDDFAAAANAEWLASQTYDPVIGCSSFADAAYSNDEKLRQLLDNKEITDKNLELLRTFDGLYSDWNYRNEIGLEPLKKYLNYIDEIKSIDDVKSYMLDNSRNPFALMLVGVETYLREESRDYYTLMITQPKYSLEKQYYYSNLNDEGLQKLEKVELMTTYVLKAAGYSEEEIKDLTSKCFQLETKLVSLNPGGYYSVYQSEIVSEDKLIEYAGAYPLKEMLEHYNLENAKNYCGDYDYLSKIDSFLTEDNLDSIKAYFKVNTVLEAQRYLTEDIFDYRYEIAVDKTNPFDEVNRSTPNRLLFYTIQKSSLKAAMDQVFLDAYYDERVHEDVAEIGKLYIEAYKKIIEEKDWLSEENKKNIEEKLDYVVFNIMKPSNEADYGDMKLLTKEEGGSLLDAFCELNKFKITEYGEIIKRSYERTFWDIYEPELSTTSAGACYNSTQNVIFINIGILTGDFYNIDMPFEEKLGRIGMVLGHELTHAFDSGGVNQDKNGDSNPIIVGDDMSTFKKKSDKVQNYYVGIKPFDGCDSYAFDNTLSKESIADMGAMKGSMIIAAEHENFDYDLFFRSFANLWKYIQTKGATVNAVRTDVHPLEYLRINVTVQQFDEFYDTYDVKPGDNMYLAPEDRIAIW